VQSLIHVNIFVYQYSIAVIYPVTLSDITE